MRMAGVMAVSCVEEEVERNLVEVVSSRKPPMEAVLRQIRRGLVAILVDV